MNIQTLQVKIDNKVVTVKSCWSEEKIKAVKSRHPPDGIVDLDELDLDAYRGPASRLQLEQLKIIARHLIEKGVE